jgi:sugar porter (SP) family MFS transporter
MIITTARAAFFAAIVTFAGGFMFGFSTGYVPVCLQYYTYVTNCTRYEAEAGCSAVSGCEWQSAGRTCAFSDRQALLPCTNFTYDQAVCKQQDGCYFDSDAGMCEHNAGWDAVDEGLISAIMIIGAMASSLVASPILGFLGRTKTIMAAGTVAIIGAIMQLIAWQEDNLGLLLAGRLLLGIAIGIGSVASPLYCGEVAPEKWKNVIGVSYQISITFGIVVAAIIGVIISPVNDTHSNDRLVDRFHVENAFTILTGVLYLVVGILVPEPTPELMAQIREAAAEGGDYEPVREAVASVQTRVRPTTDSGVQYIDLESSGAQSTPIRKLIRPLLIGFAMAGALQLTGINAIMNYAPHMTSRAGMNPLVGSCLIMVWNFVFTIVSIPLAKRFEPRKMFIIASFVTSIACLITGIPAYPGVISNEAAQHAFVWVGLLLFVAVFEIGVGPPFYPLAQASFPADWRNFGCSFCVMAQFLLNVVINFGFPVAVVALSGGESGDQNKGQALVFIIFGCIGLALSVLLAVFMKPVAAS